MKIQLASIFVQNQDHALHFYTDVLGFVKKTEIPMGDVKWLTVISPEGHDDVELVLEPNSNPIAKTFQEALYKQGIPATAFASNDIHAEYERLKSAGVKFKSEPKKMDDVTIATFDDTCGNLIQLFEV